MTLYDECENFGGGLMHFKMSSSKWHWQWVECKVCKVCTLGARRCDDGECESPKGYIAPLCLMESAILQNKNKKVISKEFRIFPAKMWHSEGMMESAKAQKVI